MTATTILQPGQIEHAAGDIPELRLPPRDLFAIRARRLKKLAPGHSLGDFLRFASALAEAQQTELAAFPDTPLPDNALLENCRLHAMPPLAPAGRQRAPQWRSVARNLADFLHNSSLVPVKDAFAAIRDESDDWLENQADQLLAYVAVDLNSACAPLIGAALQVYWTHLANRLLPQQVARPDIPSLCPVCGAHPVAALVHIGSGDESGLRYLHCALCGSEWHVVRSKCSNCDNSKDIAYYNVEGDSGAVRAEACPECNTYLKVMQRERDPDLDPFSDDLASLPLDLLMGEQGFGRSGVNYFLLHGGEG